MIIKILTSQEYISLSAELRPLVREILNDDNQHICFLNSVLYRPMLYWAVAICPVTKMSTIYSLMCSLSIIFRINLFLVFDIS